MSKGNSVVRNAIVLICLGFAVLVVAVPSVTTSWLWLIPTICVPFYASEIDERLFRFDNDVASIQVDLDAIRVDLDFIREDLDRHTSSVKVDLILIRDNLDRLEFRDNT